MTKAELQKKNDQLIQENAVLEKTNHKLRRDLNDIREQHDKVMQERNEFYADYSSLLSQCEGFKDIASRLYKDHEEALNELEKLKSNWFVKLFLS